MKLKKQVNKEAYDFAKYVSLKRFNSYWYQLNLLYSRKDKINSILEIGVGNQILGSILKKDFIYKSCDIDSELNPDYVGDISSINDFHLGDKFDAVCAFQVLEHIPYNKLRNTLKNLKQISNKYIILSLPYKNVDFRFMIKIPLFNPIKINLSFPRFWEKHRFDGEHYWEIGSKGYPLRKIINTLEEFGTIEEQFRIFENPFHYFFVIKIK